MKKSSLLSLLTATSIALTTAGTYAAWDTIEAKTSEATVTFRKPVTINVNDDLSLSTTETIGKTPSAEDTVSFTIVNDDGEATKLEIVPTISYSGSNGITIDDFNITIIDTEDSETPLNFVGSDAKSGFIDTTLTSANYKVTVTPKEDFKSKFSTSEQIKVKLTATLK